MTDNRRKGDEEKNDIECEFTESLGIDAVRKQKQDAEAQNDRKSYPDRQDSQQSITLTGSFRSNVFRRRNVFLDQIA